MDIKMRINQVLTSTKDLGVFDINDEDKVRIVVENAGSGNTVVVKARIIGQSEFVTLKTITGIANETVNVSTYEEMKIECTSFSALSAVGVKLLAASFKEAGGSAIESIGVPSGDQLTDISTLTFTSSDNSITITGDNASKTIDFTTDSGVTSVNGRTGDVFLTKVDVGLGDVDNTSDLDKPISNATQEALDDLSDRIDPIEDRSEIYKFYVYENNASIYADGRPGIRDTSTLIRDGWYFQNAAGQKINWYFFDGNPTSPTYQGAISQSNFNAYVVMTLDSKNAKPIMGVYSLPTGSGDIFPGFAHSRWVYELSTAALAPLSTGKQYLFYIGANPPAHPEIPHIQLDLVPSQSVGDKNPAELILTAALNSNSTEPANDVQWMVESLGVFSPTVKQEMGLRIRTVPLNSSSKIDAIYLPSFVDDVSEYANLAAFPNPGETGKIYVALDTNKIYRWSGSQYIEISEGAIPPVLSVNTKTGHVVLDKADIGLGNVDNTSDLNKPISTATQTALNAKYDASNPAGYITLAEVPESDVTSVNGRTGDVFLTRVDVGLGDVDNTSDLDKPISNDTQDALDLKYDASNPAGYITLAEVPESAVTSVNGEVGDVTLDKTDIGLGNVDNTSDLNKPISTATQTALNDKANKNLDNLTSTSIPAGVNLESLNAIDNTQQSFELRTKNRATFQIVGGAVTVDTTENSNSGAVRIISGNVAGNVSSGSSRLWSGDNYNAQRTSSTQRATGLVTFVSGSIYGGVGSTGAVNAFTGNIIGSTTQGDTGLVSYNTGVNEGIGNSGIIRFDTGYALNGSTGLIRFTSGNATNGNSGNIEFKSGTATGTRGKALFDVIEVDFNNVKLVNLANGTANNDAVNVSQLNDALSYSPADNSDWQAPIPDDVKEALDQLADRLQNGTGISVEAFEDMKEPTGFFNRTDSTFNLTYDSGTDTVTFTIQPAIASFQFYVKGTKYTKTTSDSIQIAVPTSGIHYIYYNPSGVLSTTATFSSDLFENNALISLFYWNRDTNTYSYFAEERHGMTMDGATHAYLHTVFGARYLSGLALQNFTIGDGSLNSHAQLTCDSGSIRDEDILLTLPAQTQIPILFRQGQLWRKKTADSYPVVYSGSAGYTGANERLPYNSFSGGNWQLTEVDQNKFVLVHYFATNDKETPIVGIQGIAQYNDVPAARSAANTEITMLSGLPFAEFAAIGTVVFQTVSTYINDINARVVPINGANYVDFRGTQLYTPAGEATTHSLLSGLSNDDHPQYLNEARGDARYSLKSAGDISETSFNLVSNQLNQPLVGFTFNNAIVRSFEALVSVEVDADSDLFEQFTIRGIQKPSGWSIAVSSIGDNSQVSFTITSLGQILYTCPLYAGFVSGKIKFRAITTSI